MTFNRRRSNHKYGATRSSFDGYSFASNLERVVYMLLKAMEQSGEIVIEKVQDRVLLSDAEIDYRPDFRIFDKRLGEQVWVEAKGFETSDWRIKRKLWMAYGPGLLRIYKGAGMNVKIHEELRGEKNESRSTDAPRTKG